MKPSYSKNNIESRDFNIITCQDFNRSQSQQALPPLRKLGVTPDYPFPRQAKFEVQQRQYNERAPGEAPPTDAIPQASLMNASSVKFNFIGLTTTNRQPLNELIKQDPLILNRKKGGMGEVADLGGLCYPNFNKDYQEKYRENSTVFRRSKGMWPSVMEPKYTYGPFMKPFKKYKF